MHIAILVTNTDRSDFAKARPGDGQKFAEMLHGVRPDWQVTVFDLVEGRFPQDGARFDGWLIGGSPASVNDDRPWIPPLMALIRGLVAAKAPLFGACFGHQAIAKALGGEVGDNPGGWVFGRVEAEVGGDVLGLYAAHTEQVLRLPDALRPAGSGPGCRVASMTMGDHVLTTQYHPEMTHDFITDLVEDYAPHLPDEVARGARDSLRKRADSAAVAERIARFFETAQR